MDCSIAREYITSYVDQELTDEISAQIDQHLEKCEGCRKEMQAQVGLHRLLSEKLERKAAPVELQRDIINGIEKETKQNPIWLFRKVNVEFKPVTGFAIAAMLLLSLFSTELINAVKQSGSTPSFNVPVLEGGQIVEANSSTIDLNQGVRATVVGQVVCIGCFLRENYLVNNNCDEHGHHIGLVTSDGNLWSFAANSKAKIIQGDLDLKGKMIQVDGEVFHNAHVIDIYDYDLSNFSN